MLSMEWGSGTGQLGFESCWAQLHLLGSKDCLVRCGGSQTVLGKTGQQEDRAHSPLWETVQDVPIPDSCCPIGNFGLFLLEEQLPSAEH
jgi:hypothetical protein